ncbi:hypothetical protein OAU50_02310 [Planctomycetota bacterium]|nr:hypothetical protein [Planctomycetota bacterium]
MFAEMIEAMRLGLGPTPRVLSKDAKKILKSKMPRWLKREKSRGIADQYKHYQAIYENGLVVWGHIIQANTLLFEPGKEDHPAAWLYSFDPYYNEQVDELAEIAGSLFSAKGEQTGDPEVQIFADTLADEFESHMRLPIPRSLTDDHDVYYTCGMVIRKHLPIPVLETNLLPLLVAPSVTNSTIILPSNFWDARFISAWTDMM